MTNPRLDAFCSIILNRAPDVPEPTYAPDSDTLSIRFWEQGAYKLGFAINLIGSAEQERFLLSLDMLAAELRRRLATIEAA